MFKYTYGWLWRYGEVEISLDWMVIEHDLTQILASLIKRSHYYPISTSCANIIQRISSPHRLVYLKRKPTITSTTRRSGEKLYEFLTVN